MVGGDRVCVLRAHTLLLSGAAASSNQAESQTAIQLGTRWGLVWSSAGTLYVGAVQSYVLKWCACIEQEFSTLQHVKAISNRTISQPSNLFFSFRGWVHSAFV